MGLCLGPGAPGRGRRKARPAGAIARLWGAADALRRVSGVLWHPGFHSYYTERRFAALRATLGQARWEELWLDGQGLPAEKVVEIALGV